MTLLQIEISRLALTQMLFWGSEEIVKNTMQQAKIRRLKDILGKTKENVVRIIDMRGEPDFVRNTFLSYPQEVRFSMTEEFKEWYIRTCNKKWGVEYLMIHLYP